MNDVTLLRFVALVPLFFFGEFALFCSAFAVAHAARHAGSALVFGCAALVSALGYPTLVELDRRIGNEAKAPRPPWRLAVCDAFFAGGGVFAAWQLAGRPGAPSIPVLLGLAAALWIVAGAAARMVARRRPGGAQTGGAQPPSKER